MSSVRKRHQQILGSGGLRAAKIGGPPVIADLYYATMEMSWPAFIILVSLVFLFLNLAFGLVYASLPGAIANAVPGSIADGFFFSVETLGTVGYGNMAPVTSLGHSIAAIEILVGLFFSATITGLIFARYARPRNCFMFSNVAVIGNYDGRRTLMVRLASIRARPIADVQAQMSWLERVETSDGRVFRRLVDLPLARSHNPSMALAWTLVHVIPEDSAMMRALTEAPEFRLIATVSGIDTLLATQAIGGQAYARPAVLLDHEFVDVVDESDDMLLLDLSKLHDVRPVERS